MHDDFQRFKNCKANVVNAEVVDHDTSLVWSDAIWFKKNVSPCGDALNHEL